MPLRRSAAPEPEADPFEGATTDLTDDETGEKDSVFVAPAENVFSVGYTPPAPRREFERTPWFDMGPAKSSVIWVATPPEQWVMFHRHYLPSVRKFVSCTRPGNWDRVTPYDPCPVCNKGYFPSRTARLTIIQSDYLDKESGETDFRKVSWDIGSTLQQFMYNSHVDVYEGPLGSDASVYRVRSIEDPATGKATTVVAQFDESRLPAPFPKELKNEVAANPLGASSIYVTPPNQVAEIALSIPVNQPKK